VWKILFAAAVLSGSAAQAGTINCSTNLSGSISCMGSLDSPEDFVEQPFTVTGAGLTAVTIQTYGFGGGMNAAGATISSGGFDSLVALFSAAPETILTDGSGNPIASIPGTTQFFPGCPPAGTVSIGGGPVCGDSALTASIGPGSYNLVLSDADYIPFAVNPGPPISSLLSDGFGDLTGGVFQTCDSDGNCISDNANFAVDILFSQTQSTPEPSALLLLAAGLVFLVRLRTGIHRSGE
jgi:PEP-CTERM motif